MDVEKEGRETERVLEGRVQGERKRMLGVKEGRRKLGERQREKKGVGRKGK